MLRDWQKESFEKIQKCNSNTEHNAIPVNACVGSGKTMLTALAFGDFIQKHSNEKTVQMFITPRIKLCKQQLTEIATKVKEQFPELDFLNGGAKYQIIPVDHTQDCYNKKNPFLSAQHVVFIVCEASLWGEDKNEPGKRWNGWMKSFKAWEKQGYVFGNAAFDESHNYKNHDKVEKLFGQLVFRKGMHFDLKRSSLIRWFKNIMLLSGTPAAYQKDLTSAFPKNVCSCPLNLAIREEWVCSPVLNLVKHDLDSAEKIYSNAVIQVVKHEQKLNPANGVRLLVNFNSIDEIAYFTRDKYIKENKGKLFHLYTIHSDKTFNDKQYTGSSLFGLTERPMIDDVEMSSGDVYSELEKIDSKQFSKPVIVCQVAMIGEGINISSFNSVITKSNSDVTAMQQIGRVLRRFNGKERPNVYCLYDNVDSLKSLLSELMLERDLTADCFSWGDKIDVKTGSSQEEKNEKETADMASNGWEKIDPNTTYEIFNIEYSDEFQSKSYHKSLSDFISTDEFDELAMLLQDFPEDLLKKTSQKMNKNAEVSREFKKANRAAKNELKKLAATSEPAEVESKKPVAEKANNAEEDSIEENEVAVPAEATKQKPKPVEQRAESMSRDLILHLVCPVRNFILKHSSRKDIIANAKKNLAALTDYIFSYSPRLADAIKKCKIDKSPAFRKAVGLND